MTIRRLFGLMILLYIQPCLSYYRGGFIMTDLISSNFTEFASDASAWTLSNSVCSSCSKIYTTPPNSCGIRQETILGGPNILGPNASSTENQYFRRYYSSLSAGYRQTALEFDLWVFYRNVPSNSSDTSFYQMTADSGNSAITGISSTLESSCKLDYIDPQGVTIKAFYKFHVRIFFSHIYYEIIDMKFQSKFTVPSTVSSFGFRNFQYYFGPTLPYGPILTIVLATFPCSSGQFWNGDACVTSGCHISCATCTGSTYNDCTSCTNGYYDYRNGTCLSSCNQPFMAMTSNGYPYLCQPKCPTDFFWYFNQSCSSTCGAPFSSYVDLNNLKICSNPCYYNDLTSAYVSKYLYPDQTCLSTCPLKVSTLGLCLSPCEGVNDSTFPNGTCTDNCHSLLAESTVHDLKYCGSPCPGQFIYSNGSCFSGCLSPLEQRIDLDPDIKFCVNPCQSKDMFLFLNGSCEETCPEPLISRSEPGTKYCFTQCDLEDFLYPDGSCFDTCDFPFSVIEDSIAKFCVNPCDSDGEFLYPNGSCSETCNFPLSTKTEPIANFCFNPCNSYDEFLFPNGSCFDTCDFPLSENIEAVAKFCFNPCGPDNEFLNPYGSCSETCDFPLSETVDSVAKYCFSPCDSNDKFLFPNGSCYDTCSSPLSITENSIAKFCYNPCNSNTEFLYPNGSCISNCNFPLSSRIEPVAKYCFSPCPSSNEYLYPYGNCSSECPFPLADRTESVAKYCSNPCSSSDMYRYPNGSCLSICPSPFVKYQQNTVNQCKTPCSNLQDFFYEIDQVCKSTCVSPFEPSKFDIIKLCSLTIQITIEEAQAAQSTVAAVASQGEATGATMKATSSFSSGNPALALLAGQASMLFYIRYVNVNYTSKLKLVFLLQDATPFSFTLGINMPNGLKEKIPDRELPEVFEQYKLHSSFLYNYWDTMSSLLSALLLIGALVLFKSGIGRFPRISKVFQSILSILKWNIPLMIVCGGFGDIYFYASLQIQAGSFDSFLEFLSLLLSVLMISSGVWILFITIKIVKDILKPENKREEIENKWQSFELLYGSYERTSLTTFAYMALFLSRTIVFNLIVANLYNYPLVQAILINVISFTMFGYLIMKRPLKNLLELVQLFMNEIFVIIVNICVLILAIMDQADIIGKELRNGVCETIIKIIMIFSSSSLAFVALQMLISIFFFLKLLRRLKAEGKLNPSRIIKTFFSKESRENEVQPQKSENNQIVIDSSRPIIHPRIRRMKRRAHSPSKIHTESQIQEIDPSDLSPPIHRGEKSFAVFNNTNQSYLESQSNTERTFDVLNLSSLRISPVKEISISRHRKVYPDESFSNPNQLTLENNSSGIIRLQDYEGKDGLKYTISQYRKLKNYLRRSGDL